MGSTQIHNIYFVQYKLKETSQGLYNIDSILWIFWIADKMKAEVCEPGTRNRILLETSDEFSIDLSHQPDNEPEASFRKLNVD